MGLFASGGSASDRVTPNVIDTQSWKRMPLVQVGLGLMAIVSAPKIQDHVGEDDEYASLAVPEGIRDRCDRMEVWGSCIDPLTGKRSTETTIWELRFMKGTELVAVVSRLDPARR